MHPMDSSSQWIVLAQVLRPQGRRGEVLADLFTDFPERFEQHRSVWLAPQGFADHTVGGAALPAAALPAAAVPAEVDSH